MYSVDLLCLRFAPCILENVMLFYEFYGCCNQENMDMETENTKNMKKSKVPSKNTTKAVGKTKMTKEERSRLMEEKKLQKEVCFSL